MHRPHVEDASPALLVHARQDGLRQQERRGEHQLGQQAPARLGKLDDGGDVLDAGVVDEDIEPSLLRQRLRDDALAFA